MGTQPENTHEIQTQTQPNPYPKFGSGSGITLGYPNFGYPILTIDRIQFFIMTTLWFDKIFNFSVQMYEIFDLKKDTYILFKNYGFAIRDNFCKAFAKIVPISKNYN